MSDDNRMLCSRIQVQRVGIRLAGIGLTWAMGLSISGAIGEMSITHLFVPQPAIAQRIRPDNVWRAVYERLPELPLENHYISKETGKVDLDNTLVARLIRYHVYLKGRPPLYRLDWKITMADYLGVNGAMEDSTYPSHNTLRKNPLEGDIAAINRLNRTHRDALVQALVDAFSSQQEGEKS